MLVLLSYGSVLLVEAVPQLWLGLISAQPDEVCGFTVCDLEVVGHRLR